MQGRAERRRLSGESGGHGRALCPGIFAGLSGPVSRRRRADTAADILVCQGALLDRRRVRRRVEISGGYDRRPPNPRQYAESQPAGPWPYLQRSGSRPSRAGPERIVASRPGNAGTRCRRYFARQDTNGSGLRLNRPGDICGRHKREVSTGYIAGSVLRLSVYRRDCEVFVGGAGKRDSQVLSRFRYRHPIHRAAVGAGAAREWQTSRTSAGAGVQISNGRNHTVSRRETMSPSPGQGFSPELRFVNEPIAIVGIAGFMPQSEDLDVWWENLKNSKDLITVIPEDRWNWEDYYGNPLKEVK